MARLSVTIHDLERNFDMLHFEADSLTDIYKELAYLFDMRYQTIKSLPTTQDNDVIIIRLSDEVVRYKYGTAEFEIIVRGEVKGEHYLKGGERMRYQIVIEDLYEDSPDESAVVYGFNNVLTYIEDSIDFGNTEVISMQCEEAEVLRLKVFDVSEGDPIDSLEIHVIRL